MGQAFIMARPAVWRRLRRRARRAWALGGVWAEPRAAGPYGEFY